MKTKPWYKSTSIWSGTALITLFLTMCSLYYKSKGDNLGETIPLAILAIGSYVLNMRGRVKADSKLTLK